MKWKKSDANRKVYTSSILGTIFVGVFIVVSKFVDDLYTNLLIFIPLATVLSIVGWIIMKPVRKELKKGGTAEAKIKASLNQLPPEMTKLYIVLGWFLGIPFLILGSLLLGITLFTDLSDSVILGGAGGISLIIGAITLFAARGLSKGKKWGLALLISAILISLLFMVLFPFLFSA